MIRGVLSIGSNMADRRARLASVPRGLREHPRVMVEAISSLYATAPWGVTDQNEFLNAALIVRAGLTPMELLALGQELEQAAHRTRLRRWGPRTLDVDIVAVTQDGEQIRSSDPQLTLPHPYAHQRAFVLVPWLEMEPDAVLGGIPVREHLDSLSRDEVSGVRRVGPVEDNSRPEGGPAGADRGGSR